MSDCFDRGEKEREREREREREERGERREREKVWERYIIREGISLFVCLCICRGPSGLRVVCLGIKVLSGH